MTRLSLCSERRSLRGCARFLFSVALGLEAPGALCPRRLDQLRASTTAGALLAFQRHGAAPAQPYRTGTSWPFKGKKEGAHRRAGKLKQRSFNEAIPPRYDSDERRLTGRDRVHPPSSIRRRLPVRQTRAANFWAFRRPSLCLDREGKPLSHNDATSTTHRRRRPHLNSLHLDRTLRDSQPASRCEGPHDEVRAPVPLPLDHRLESKLLVQAFDQYSRPLLAVSAAADASPRRPCTTNRTFETPRLNRSLPSHPCFVSPVHTPTIDCVVEQGPLFFISEEMDKQLRPEFSTCC